MKKYLIIPLLLILAGCATSYEKAGTHIFSDKFGYSDYQIDQNKFSVSFRANAFTSQEKVMSCALKRASELTLANSYTHFVILNTKDEGASKPITGQYGMVIGCQYIPAVTMHIACFKDTQQEGAYDARDF